MKITISMISLAGLTHSFIHQIFIEHLSEARHLRYISEHIR